MAASSTRTAIAGIDVSAYRIPTDRPEEDGTFRWDATTLVVVEAHAGGESGLGYTYAAAASGAVIEEQLAAAVRDHDAMDVTASWQAMVERCRNLGLPGAAAMAVSAVDVALWDLKARLLSIPLVDLLGAARASVPIYGSGGFTSYSDDELCHQLAGWVADGIPRAKMKIGRDPAADRRRVALARSAIGDRAELFVDANGAYSVKHAVAQAEAFAHEGVTWFEEPVSSDDLTGLRQVREAVRAPIEVAAGEYGFEPSAFRRLLEAEAVDVLQADATRCLGITGFLRAGALADAFARPLSAHCAPALHLHPCCAVPRLRHLEWFHDHVRIERLLFEGAPEPEAGEIAPDRSRPGHGLELRRADAARYAL